VPRRITDKRQGFGDRKLRRRTARETLGKDAGGGTGPGLLRLHVCRRARTGFGVESKPPSRCCLGPRVEPVVSGPEFSWPGPAPKLPEGPAQGMFPGTFRRRKSCAGRKVSPRSRGERLLRTFLWVGGTRGSVRKVRRP